MEESLAVQNIEAFCRLWSEEPDETRRRILEEVLGSAFTDAPSGLESAKMGDRPRVS